MAERIVKVSLVAQVNNYVAGMEKAAAKTREFGTEAEKVAQKKQALADIGGGLLAIGAVAAVGVGLAVAKFVEFDQAISNVKAATQESAENMDLLREAALQAGADTAFSAIEAANAVEELGKAGLTTEQILGGGLDGALSLAAAGGLGVAEAASIAAIAVKQFNLEGSDVPMVADLLAAGAGKAVGSVQDLGAALGQAGLVANGAGQSIEDTTGVLAAFADAGLLGSDAGTSLKSAIIALQAPTQKSQAVMEKYNLSFYDGAGNMLSYSEIAGQLETELGGLDDQTRNAALAQIFGNDALRVANVLYDEGAKGIQGYIDQTNDSGYAAKVAADRLNNLAGDVEALGGSFDTALIQTGSGANGVLRELVQTATVLVNAIGGLPSPVLDTALALGGVVAAVGLAGGAALVAVPKVAAFKVALETLKVSAGKAALGVGLLTGGLVVVGAAVAIFASEQAKGAARTDEYTASLEAQSAALTGYSREIAVANLSAEQSFGPFKSQSTFDAAKSLGLSLDLVTDAALGNVKALREVDAESRIGVAGSDKLARQMEETGLSALELAEASQAVAFGVKGESESVAEAIRVAKQKQEVDKDTAVSTEEVAAVFDEASGASEDYSTAVLGLVDALRDYGKEAFDVEGSTDSFYAAFDELAALLKDGKGSLDQTTEAGRETSAALLDTAKSTNDYAAAVLNSGGSTEEVQGILEAGRQKLIDTRIALGDSEEAARLYADQLVKTPEQIETEIKVNTNQALTSIDDFILKMGQKSGVINFRANLPDLNGVTVSGNGRMGGFASGGAISGPGTGTSDTAGLYALSNGEHVLTAAEVAAMGGQSAVYDFRRGLKSPSYMSAPSLSSGGGFGSSSRGGDTFTIYETTDPVATAQAVQRRQSALGSV